jgi:diguanylate cyclase (GGDEF)-like protein/PAS domain S-box-containing protein
MCWAAMSNRSILRTTVFYISISVAFIILISTLIEYYTLKNNFIQNAQKASDKSIELLKTNIKASVESYAINEYMMQLKTELMMYDYLAITIEDYKLAQISGKTNSRLGYIKNKDNIVEFSEDKDLELLKSSYRTQEAYVYSGESPIAKITIYQTDKKLMQQIGTLISNKLINALFIILTLIFVIYFLIKKIIIKPINELISSLKITDETGIPNPIVSNIDYDEFKYLIQTINTMIQTITKANAKMSEQTKEIHQEKYKYQNILNLASDGIFIMDTQGKLIEYSYKTMELLRADKDEMKNLSVFDWDKNISHEQFQEFVAMLQHSAIEIEREHTRKDNSTYLAHITASLINIGENIYIYSSVRDVTEQKTMQNEIIHERNFISTIINTANAVIAVIEADGTMSLLNRYGEDFSGYSREEVASEPYFWKRFLEKDLQENVVEIFNKAKEGKITHQYQNAWFSRTGERKMFEWSNQIVMHENGELNYIFTIGIDIQEQIQAQTQLTQQRDELESIFHTALSGIAIVDLDTKFLFFNNKYLELLEYSKEELQTKSCMELTSQEYLQEAKAVYEKVFKDGYYENFERICITKSGKQKRLNSSIALMHDKKRLLISTVDHTTLHDAIQTIKKQTYTDELTQLNNRKSYNKRVAELLSQRQRYHNTFSILMFDIDFFKSINDVYGHQKGDEILVRLSNIVASMTRANDYAFRVGGEEFVILLTNTALANASVFAQKLRGKIESDLSPFEERTITISIGVTEVQEDDTTVSLFKRVDKNLYEAKENGRNKVVSS